MLAPDPMLSGHVRLEPLSQQHVPGLAAASAGSPDLYRLTNAPAGETAAAAYVAAAQAARQAGTAAPFAVVRLADDTVIGSTRLWGLQWRA